jgi:iron complex outermembrane receptor protein
MGSRRLRPGNPPARRTLPSSAAPPARKANMLALAVGCTLAGLACAAALVPGAVRAAETLDSAGPRDYAIPAGRLGDALAQFAATAGVPLSFDPRMLAGLRSNGLQGRYTARAGFAQLLAGSGYELVDTGGGYSLRPVAAGDGGAIALPPVTVTGTAVPLPGDLPPEYAGGQVARGGKLGVLGNRDMMDTPFNQTSYTSKLIQDQQSNFIADTLKNDPSAIISSPPSTGVDGFVIRGFSVNNTDILFNGMAGVAPSYANSMMAESIERVEVLKGPSALLNGMAPNGSVGGTINTVPKRAGDEPLTQFTSSYNMDSQFGGHVDIARRFGSDKEFGVRFNGVYRDGDTPIDNQSRESRLAALGLDYRGDRIRLSSDLGYQYQDVEGTRRYASVAANSAVPKAPDNRRNFFSPWEFSTPEVYYGTFRGEFDVTDNVTAYAALGGSQREQRLAASNRTIINAMGDLAAGRVALTSEKMISMTGDVGLRASFDTGPVSHQATIGHSWLDREWRSGRRTIYTFPASNIYSPTYGDAPDSALFLDPDDVGKVQDLVLTSTVIGDTLSILEERVQLTLGARFQQVDQKSFDGTTGSVTGRYNDDAITPMVGLVVKPWRNVSLYGHYIEGLQQGATAPVTAANAGEIFPPYVAKQYEVGAKIDFGRITTTVAAYQIALPSAITDPATNVFSIDGEQRHRGVDFNIFGEVTDGLRLLGGVSYINSELTRTSGRTNDGKTGFGAPEYRLVAGAEWDTPFLQGLTLTGRFTYTDSAYLDAANTVRVPSWTRLDIGARYRIERAQGKPIILRASIDNVLNSNYWVSDSGGFLALSEPLTFRLSATFDF